MKQKKPSHFLGWRFDINLLWEAYNRIFYSFKKSQDQKQSYLCRLYQGYFVVFSYSFLDALCSHLILTAGKKSQSFLNGLSSLEDKIAYVSNISKSYAVEQKYKDFFADIKWVRHEIIHPRVSDHAVVATLESLNFAERMEKLNRLAISIYATYGLPFPYWLTGWNYVNTMTSDDPNENIVLLNNDQFMFSLQALGFRFSFPLPGIPGADKKHMRGEEEYIEIVKFLDSREFTIQGIPENVGYQFMPILIRDWWSEAELDLVRSYRRSILEKNRKLDWKAE